MSRIHILSHDQISLKLDRIAWQILEEHYGEHKLVLVGLVKQGYDVAEKIKARLVKNSDLSIELLPINLDKTKPLTSPVSIKNSDVLDRSAVILVDDVLNSGITMAAALKEVLNYNPKSVKTAVLANRDHNKFPIQANYVGISLATTLKEHISYTEEDKKMSITLS